MKRAIWVIGIVGVVIIVLVVYGKVRGVFSGFGFGDASGGSGSVTVMPRDTNYMPVEYDVHRAKSEPFGVGKSSGVKLPAGVKEKDVRKVTRVELTPSPSLTREGGKSDSLLTLDLIETEDGEVYVRRDSSIVSVTVTRFAAPVFDLGLRFGLGVSSSFPVGVSPVGVMSLCEWYGFVEAPVVSVDLAGVGVGAQLQLYNDIYVGMVHTWRYDIGREYRVTLDMMF